jgi:hypothetical protein
LTTTHLRAAATRGVGLVEAPPLGGVVVDSRLEAHRQFLRDAAELLLRRQTSVWSAGDLDDAARAVATITVPSPTPAPSEPSMPTSPVGMFGRIAATCGLDLGEEAVVAAAWWTASDPAVRALFAALHDDPGRRFVSLAALRATLQPLGFDVPLTGGTGDRLVDGGLLAPVVDPSAAVALTPTVLRLLSGWRPPAELLPTLPARLDPTVRLVSDLLAAGRRVVLRSEVVADAQLVARAVAARAERCAAEPGPDPGQTELLVSLDLLVPVRGLTGETEAAVADDGVDDRARVVIGGARATAPPGWHVVDVDPLDLAGRTKHWRRALVAAGLPKARAAALAARLRLTEAQIDLIVATAVAEGAIRGRDVTIADLELALRRHPRHTLADLARPLPVSTPLDELVLSETTRSGLELLLAHARHSAAAMTDWSGARGRGVVALLHGPSGTGKTAAAEALGAELGREVWAVDLAQVVSKWLGETQRNLDRVLSEGSRAAAILLFDEADGLFGRRAEVSDARDRYANLEIDHLLQRVELHDGIVLLTSNRPAAIDDAFARRLRLRIRFDLPDHGQRTVIWQRQLAGVNVADDLDVADVARTELTGGAIRAAALTARVLAIDADEPIDRGHLQLAVQSELEKVGRRFETRAPTIDAGTGRQR